MKISHLDRWIIGHAGTRNAPPPVHPFPASAGGGGYVVPQQLRPNIQYMSRTVNTVAHNRTSYQIFKFPKCICEFWKAMGVIHFAVFIYWLQRNIRGRL